MQAGTDPIQEVKDYWTKYKPYILIGIILLLVGIGVIGNSCASYKQTTLEKTTQVSALQDEDRKVTAEKNELSQSLAVMKATSESYKAKYESEQKEKSKLKTAVVDLQGKLQLDANGNPVFNEVSSSSSDLTTKTEELEKKVTELTQQTTDQTDELSKMASKIITQQSTIDTLSKKETIRRGGTSIGALWDTQNLNPWPSQFNADHQLLYFGDVGLGPQIEVETVPFKLLFGTKASF